MMELLKLTTAVQGSMNSNHWVGSCSINNVVDQNTKVIGTENLYSDLHIVLQQRFL